MNIGRLYEQYFNIVSRYVRFNIRNKVSEYGGLDILTDEQVNELFNYVLGILEILGTEQYEGYKKTTIHDRRVILHEIVTEEFYIYYKVSSPKKPFQLVLEIEKSIYKPPYMPIEVNKNGELKLTKDSMYIGPEYIILLAKTPDNYLATSSAKTNHYGMPVGASTKDKLHLPYRGSPVKILSETDARLYLANVGERASIELKDRGNSQDTHAHIYRELLSLDNPSNVDNLVDRTEVPYGKDSSLELIDSIFNASGIEIVYE